MLMIDLEKLSSELKEKLPKMTIDEVRRSREIYNNIVKAECEDSLAQFVKSSWHIIEPGTTLVWNWHLDVVCAYLEEVYKGNIRRLIINVPPGSMKSSIVSVCFPVWVWIKDATHKFLGIANEQGLALRDALKAKNIIEDDWFQEKWPMGFNKSQNEKMLYLNDKRGYRQSLGVTGKITGKRGDTLLIDDPHDATEVESELQRQSVINIYDSKISTRLNHPKDSAIVLIMQRLNQLDLTGHLLAKKKTKWIQLIIPMEYEGTPRFNPGRDIGRPDLADPRKKDGELFFPKRFDEESVESLKEDLSEYGAAGQLQQRPSPKGGGILKRHWWKLWPDDKPLPKCEHVFASWDTAYSEKDLKNNSYSAMTKWGVFWHEQKQAWALLLLSAWDGQVDYPDLREHANKIEEEDQPDCQLIEKKASGQCYDEKTEVLTKNGWKLFKDIDIETDKFATRNMITKNLEWQVASSQYSAHYNGDMYHFKGRAQDAMVTPNHRMLVTTLPAKMGGHPELKKKCETFITAEEYYKYGGEKTKFPCLSGWTGEEIVSKSFPIISDINAKGYRKKRDKIEKEIKCTGDDYIAFMAMYLSEGWTQTNIKYRYYSVHIGQYKKSPSYIDFKNVMTRMIGKPPGERRDKELIITRLGLYQFVRNYGHYCDSKFIPDDIMNSSKKQLQMFWDYYMKGDGHTTKHGHQAITTTSQKMAGQLQEVAQKLGGSASVRLASVPREPFRIGNNKHLTKPENLKPCYIVRFRTSKTQAVKPSKVQYDGMISCVSVPNTTLYVRRNGFPMWCGNSLVQDLRRSGAMVRTYNPDRDKIARAYSVQAMLKSGLIYAPNRRWADKVIDMLAVFPNGASPSSDYTDTCTQAWIYLREGLWIDHPDDEKSEENNEKSEREAAYG